MKRFVQLVAILAVVFLAAQPALAGMACAPAQSAACIPGCPMAMSAMGPDCQMTGNTVTGDCPQNCCSLSLSQRLAPLAAPRKLHLSLLASATVLSFAVPTAEPSVAVHAPISAQAVSPPHYLLNQVFRI
jgi:hypothetical protein